jgi:hypothetical protein
MSAFAGLYIVISQKIQLFITTAVRTSDPNTRINVWDIGKKIHIFIDVSYTILLAQDFRNVMTIFVCFLSGI